MSHAIFSWWYRMFLREKVQLLKFGCLSMNRCETGHKISVKNKLENDTQHQKQREKKEACEMK